MLKRKFEALQSQSADEHELLETLRSASEEDATALLAHLRSRCGHCKRQGVTCVCDTIHPRESREDTLSRENAKLKSRLGAYERILLHLMNLPQGGLLQLVRLDLMGAEGNGAVTRCGR